MIKSVREERHSDAFRAWTSSLPDGTDVVAPHLLRYELGQFLRNDTAWDAERRRAVLEHLLREVRYADGAGIEELAPPLTYYDGAYLALARALRVPLVTYDGVLAKAARSKGVDVLSPS